MDYSFFFSRVLFISFVMHFLLQLAFEAIVISAVIKFPKAKCNLANQKQKSSHDVDFMHEDTIVYYYQLMKQRLEFASPELSIKCSRWPVC